MGAKQRIANASLAKAREDEELANASALRGSHALELARRKVADADEEKQDASLELARAHAEEKVMQAANATLLEEERRVNSIRAKADKESAEAMNEESALKVKAAQIDHEAKSANATLAQ